MTQGAAPDWLSKGRARGYLWLLAAANLAVLAYLLIGSRGGVDRGGFLLGTDFLSFWTAGRMLAAGQDVYDTAAHIAAQRATFTAPGSYTAFFYPPLFLPLCRPLGALGYFPALAAWLAVTGALYAAAVRTWLRGTGLAVSPWLALAAFAPVLVTITHGQTAFLVAGLLGLGLWLVPTRPWLAGALIGLAAIKPQLGLLVPLALLGARQWRAIAGAALAVAGLALIATAEFGFAIWPAWRGASDGAAAALTAGAVPYAKMVSVFAAVRLVGGGTTLAWFAQGAAAAAVGGAILVRAWRRGFDPALAALVLAGAPLATPFVLDYDLVLLAFPLAWLAARAERRGDRLIVAAGFVLALFARPAAVALGVPLAPLVLAAVFAAVWRAGGRPSGVDQFGV